MRALRGVSAAMLLGGALVTGMAVPAAAKEHPRPAGGKHATAKKPARARTRQQWQLDIPRIGVATRLLTLGAPRGDALPVPSLLQADTAAWYQFTAVPGRPGNAVLVGHVDTYVGPAVFYDLYLLAKGDPVYVRVGKQRLRFVVTGVTEVPKEKFPVTEVFGGTSARMLRIITCGGNFDYATRHYMDNIIVSAAYRPAGHREHQ
jgi:LPXTG-site transpeptidase (sortase) family protein